MKKLIILLAIFLFSYSSFAKSDVNICKLVINKIINTDVKNGSDNYIMPVTIRYFYRTSCGVIATASSNEPVSSDAIQAWVNAMEEYYCEQL